MILTVKPAEFLKGRFILPPSKSYSIRAFITASCGGDSRIINPSDCDDAVVSVNVAKALGSDIKQSKNNVWKIKGAKHAPRTKKINVHESGTVLRFLLPLLSLRRGRFTVMGKGTLKGRPNRHLTKTLRRMGVDIRGRGVQESIPIRVKGGNIKTGKIEIEGTVSSQFISALLIAAPHLQEDTKLLIKGKKIVSSDYVVMTQQVLKQSGISVKRISPRAYHIKGGQKFKGLKNFNVPSDYGLAAFFLAGAALLKSDVVLYGALQDTFVQADGKILSLLRKMGVRFKKTAKSLHIKGPFRLKGGRFSLKNCPDLVPIMAVLALFAQGKTTLCDIGHARTKESDRISDLRKELLKVGARVKEKPQELSITPQKSYKKNVVLNPHRDHRLAMAFSILGLKLGARVKDIECTAKSYPGFVRDLRAIGGKVRKSK